MNKTLKMLLLLLVTMLVMFVISQLAGGFILCYWLKLEFSWSVFFLIETFQQRAYLVK